MQALEQHAESLDEAFLSNCFAYIQKVAEDGHHGATNALQKILQLYAARQLRQSEPQPGEDTLLLDVLTADAAQWDSMLEDLVTAGAPLDSLSLPPPLAIACVLASLGHRSTLLRERRHESSDIVQGT